MRHAEYLNRLASLNAMKSGVQPCLSSQVPPRRTGLNAMKSGVQHFLK